MIKDSNFKQNFKQNSKKIIGIAVPSGLNSLLDITNVMIGLFMLSKLSSYHIVAVGLGLNFFMFLYSLCNILFVGTNVQISRLYGSGNFDGIKEVLSSMFFGSLLLSIPVYLLTNSLHKSYFDWIIDDPIAQILGEAFLGIILISIPALLAKTILISSFAAIGDTKRPFIIKLVITCINLFLNYVLIFGVFFEKLDIVGMAVSNLFVSYLELLILLILLFRRKIPLGIKYFLCFKIVRKGLVVGFPTGVERILTIGSLVLISKFVALYGSDYLAGLQIGSRIEAFSYMPGFGFLIASMTLVGQYIGANKKECIKELMYTSIIISSIFMCVMGFIMTIGSRYLSSIFSTNEDIIYSSMMYLICVGISQIPLVLIFIFDGAFRGAGATKASLYINTTSIWLLRIFPMYVCVKFQLSIVLIYVIILVETFIRGLVFLVVFNKFFDRLFVSKSLT